MRARLSVALALLAIMTAPATAEEAVVLHAAGRSIYGELIAQGAADIFLTYCTSALAAQRVNPAQQIVHCPTRSRSVPITA